MFDTFKTPKLYNEHIERKLLNREIRQKKFYTFVVLPIITTIIIIFIYLFIKYRKRGNSLRMQLLDEKDNIKKKDSIIDDLRFKQSLIEGKIRSKNEELKKKNEIIKSQELELIETRNKIIDIDKPADINAFLESEICKRIISQNRNRISALDNNELNILIRTANFYLNNFTIRMKRKYPELKKDDMHYLCLLLLRMDNYQISMLLNKNRKTIWDRIKNIRKRMNLDEDVEIYNVVMDIITPNAPTTSNNNKHKNSP